MRALHILAGIALFLLVLCLAYLTVNAAISEAMWYSYLGWLANHPLQTLMGSTLCILLVILYLYTERPRRAQEQFISFESEGGLVSISMKAVRDFLARLADEFAAIVHLEPVIRPAAGSIEVEMEVKVKSGTQIPELCRMLQERVRESIRENLGLTEIRGVKVSVKEIIAPPAKKKVEEPHEWEAPVKP